MGKEEDDDDCMEYFWSILLSFSFLSAATLSEECCCLLSASASSRSIPAMVALSVNVDLEFCVIESAPSSVEAYWYPKYPPTDPSMSIRIIPVTLPFHRDGVVLGSAPA